jgi:uncharacterized damage-inducible protein DinB
MPGEASHFAFFFERTILDIIAQISDISDADLNRSLELPEGNTLFIITTHLLGSADYWVMGMAGGQSIQRDRRAEFQASGTRAELVERCHRWLTTMQDVLDTLPDEQLDQLAPGEEPLTVRDGLLHALQHCSLHLGQIQLTRQLLGYAPPQKSLPNIPAGPLEPAS